ncbi:DNA-3-methyladenine glycosylase family protein [Chondromyces apiculatus]|nr:DNA-3-methyladenine glycosylase 2 family protein [Chondromyces apiculatus]
MGELIARVGACGLRAGAGRGGDGRSHFTALTAAIVGQQLSPKAADTIFARVVALGPGGKLPDPAGLLEIPEDVLRTAGLSGSKARSMRDLAARIVEGTLRLEALDAMDDEEIITSLSQVRGIGRWTAEMFLMFQLGRPDILPVGDLGVQKGLVRLFSLRKLPRPERMHTLMRPFRPHRSVACWYLWRLNEMPADVLRPPRRGR